VNIISRAIYEIYFPPAFVTKYIKQTPLIWQDQSRYRMCREV